VRLGNFDVLELVGVPALPEQSYDEALESVQAALDDGSPLAAGVHDLELRLAARWEREPPHVVARRAAPAATFAFALRGTPDASVVCEYREDAADADAAKDLLADFARAIEIQARSDTPPAPAAWFSPGGESAPSRRDVSAVPCAIHDLVAKQTALRPDARAVSGTSGSFTYRALDAAADEIAGALQDAGVGRGDRVGVCVSRDIGLVAALLGVLKSGAAYVPLDGSYPQERLDYMAADAALSVVVAAPSLAVRFAGKLVIAVDERGNCERGAVARAPARRPHAEPSDAAYVIYTSGSTGVPKGVVVEHRNFSALLAATRDEFALSDTDVWTCFHSCAFDFSVWEIWACLATGGELVVVTDGAAREPQEFRELLRERRVTVLNQTPSAFSNLLAAEREHAPDLALRLVIFGGEPLDARILLPWFDRYPEDRCRVVNMFGITETTVHCTHVTLTRPEALAGSRSVGVPLPGWQIYVLDPMGVPLPAGVAGEIYVGGGGVARGYLGKPGLTAQRFRPDNVANSGHRLYRSGDKGRMRRDGQLEHLGRLD
ncbi:MAG TPA: amino acid adenylation domain-containing protein, partial [Candidatus Elarobacter sp.]|nr:amino acid adenylation domain-containing protein [Candidatus Elarobacter sp.]